jgi:hypothetical protein
MKKILFLKKLVQKLEKILKNYLEIKYMKVFIENIKMNLKKEII